MDIVKKCPKCGNFIVLDFSYSDIVEEHCQKCDSIILFELTKNVTSRIIKGE